MAADIITFVKPQHPNVCILEEKDKFICIRTSSSSGGLYIRLNMAIAWHGPAICPLINEF